MSEQGQSQEARGGRASRIGMAWQDLLTGVRTLSWRQVLLFGVVAGLLMPLTIIQPGSALSFLAGIVPVGAGLLIGRRVKHHYALHGFATGVISATVGVLFMTFLLFGTGFGPTLVEQSREQLVAQGMSASDVGVESLWAQFAGLILFSLLTFCTFGASMAGRSEERNRALRGEVEARGGRLERPSAVRTADDIRGMSLPQFGGYVNSLFKKQGFTFKDYRFVDKDKHLDLWLEHEGEPWHLRLTVVDKVSPGTIEGLSQEMKREGCRKGVVLTSTEFTPGAAKSVKGRPIVLIDGPMLFEIAEKK